MSNQKTVSQIISELFVVRNAICYDWLRRIKI